MSDLEVRLRWQAEHHRDELIQLLADAIPADVLRDAWAAHMTRLGTRPVREPFRDRPGRPERPGSLDRCC